MTAAEVEHNSFAARWRRTRCLIGKEARQIVRDPSSIAIGIVLPVVLILLFGYGLSLDVTEVPVAVVLEDTSPAATDLAASFQLSHYFDVQLMTSMARAEQLMLGRKVDGIIRIRPDFARMLSMGDAEVQVLVHGVDANHARIVQGYARKQNRRRAGDGAEPHVVQRGQREPLFFGARLDRVDHDADRRAADCSGHGARMGARHA